MEKDEVLERINERKQLIIDNLNRLNEVDVSNPVLADCRAIIYSSLRELTSDLGSINGGEMYDDFFSLFQDSIDVIESDQGELLVSVVSGRTDSSRALVILFRMVAMCVTEALADGREHNYPDYFIRLAAYFFGVSNYKDDNVRVLSQKIFFSFKTVKLTINSDFRRSVLESYHGIKTIKDDIERDISDFEVRLAEREERADALVVKSDHYIEIIEKHKIALGIDALAASFEVFRTKKKDERDFNLVVVGVLLLAMILLPACLFAFGSFDTQEDILPQVVRYLPFASIELVFLYLFRISIIQFNSIQAQLLQLDLRIAASKFVQEFSAFKKEADVDISKFESLVFSGIVAELERTPSTFDGIKEVISSIKEGK
ncbi:MAG: hypothetical protein Q7T32_06870 [Moraxellaceae bacterium]|nr:hypothetical protein [Moraxellaceae bacterium]